jgi:hypothetical protein
MRSARHRADSLRLDYSHFTGQRRWTDDQLAGAVRNSRSWSQVVDSLGLKGGSSPTSVKAHAIRLALDIGHLQSERPTTQMSLTDLCPALTHLPRAGSMLAAAWFTLCGHDVSWPLEPCRYDLLVVLDHPVKIQVKTASVRSGTSWEVWLSSSGKERRIYDPEEIDYFFVIDGNLDYYLIPVAVVGGFHTIRLAAYAQYKLPRLAA